MTSMIQTPVPVEPAEPVVPHDPGPIDVSGRVDLRELVDVVIGVDTHRDTHTAAVIDARTGAHLATQVIEATFEGYQALVEFTDTHSKLRAWAIEGTGSHGAGLAHLLSATGEIVIELDRPERTPRRNGAKSDAIDAIRAAREALARPRLSTPRARGTRKALAVLIAARRSAVTAKTAALHQIHGLLITAPDPLRDRFRGLSATQALASARRLRTHTSDDIETTTFKTTLKALANRIHDLTHEAQTHEKALHALVRSWRPDLLALPGIGPITAAIILNAWSHPGRIHSEAAFAMIAGTAPIPANSGRITNRHRINPAGDRELNWATSIIAINRTRFDPDTRAYITRRTAEGKTPKEIRRCLKRYITRQLYRTLENPTPTT